MAFLDKSVLLSKTGLRRETLFVPDLDGEVLLRELTGSEIDVVKRQAAKDNGAVAMTTALAVRFGWINEDGSHVLSDDDLSTMITEVSFAVIDLMATKIMELSGNAGDTKAAAKKGSTRTRNGASGSS